MSKVTNRQAGALVRARTPFRTGNGTVFAEYQPSDPFKYIVYSYGYHFPMYIYHWPTGTWFGNSAKYSVTTTRHKSQCSPEQVHVWLDTAGMQRIRNMPSLELTAFSIRNEFPEYPKRAVDDIVRAIRINQTLQEGAQS